MVALSKTIISAEVSYLRWLPYTIEEVKVYGAAQNGYIGDIFYPQKFHFGCEQLWISDISNCLREPWRKRHWT